MKNPVSPMLCFLFPELRDWMCLIRTRTSEPAPIGKSVLLEEKEGS